MTLMHGRRPEDRDTGYGKEYPSITTGYEKEYVRKDHDTGHGKQYLIVVSCFVFELFAIGRGMWRCRMKCALKQRVEYIMRSIE